MSSDDDSDLFPSTGGDVFESIEVEVDDSDEYVTLTQMQQERRVPMLTESIRKRN